MAPEAILRWSDVNFAIAKRSLRRFFRASDSVTLLHSSNGELKRGEMLAIMGPSGAGKSTLLDILSGRVASTGNGATAVEHRLTAQEEQHERQVANKRSMVSYVEQHDSLLGVLTVEETLYYSTKLSMPLDASHVDVRARVDAVLDGLGLRSVASNQIGTPIKRGISGGQKRRVTIGCSLVAMPHVLFLDEPTSGLDVHTAYGVMSSIRRFAQQHDIAVCATIHSPNIDIFHLFNNVLLLAKGRTVYYGDVKDVARYMDEHLGQPCAMGTNPADHMLRVISDDTFGAETAKEADEEGAAAQRLSVAEMGARWRTEQGRRTGRPAAASNGSSSSSTDKHASPPTGEPVNARTPLFYPARRLAFATRLLTQRNAINYRRNLLAYGVRFAMYVGMGVLLATVWVNLAQTDTRITDRLSVHFFSVAFLGFMSVAGIPSFLEERAVMRRERGNGLYGPAPFTLANTFVTMPFLFVCALAFAVLAYWSIGLNSSAFAFLRWLAFLYIGVLAAEMQSLLVAAVLPIFVASLAVAAFLNGFWMTTQGYFIRTANLPRFWYYWAHFINYQTYALALLARTDLVGLRFQCERRGQCAFPPTAALPDVVTGETVIEVMQFDSISFGSQAAILLSIVVVYRLLFYAVLKMQKA